MRVTMHPAHRLPRPGARWQAARDAAEPDHDRRNGALPPGHPVTWGAIADGTLLQGAAYEYQAPAT